MLTKLFTACSCALFAALGIASVGDPAAEEPAGPPELAVAVAVDNRTVEVDRFIERTVERTVTDHTPSFRRRGSKPAETRRELGRVVEVVTTRHIAGIDVVAERADGGAVSTDALVALLARPTAIVIVPEGEPVHAIFGKILKPDTLVVRLSGSSQNRVTSPSKRPSN